MTFDERLRRAGNQAAQREARKLVLEGPGTPGRRWLVERLGRLDVPQEETGAPVAISDPATDDRGTTQKPLKTAPVNSQDFTGYESIGDVLDAFDQRKAPSPPEIPEEEIPF